MTKCENCICNPVCDHNQYGWENCNNYIDKSRIVNLPCNVGDTIYYIGNMMSVLTLKVVSVHLSDEGSIRKKKHKSHFIAIEKNSNLNCKYNLDIVGTFAFLDYDEAVSTLARYENNGRYKS